MHAEVHALYVKAKEAAGRVVEVQELPSGEFIVEWLSFEHKPPPKGKTEKEALENFITHIKSLRSPHGDN